MIDKIASFLYTNTLWIFVTIILIVAMVLMVDSKKMATINLSNYFFIVGIVSLLFSPVLVYGWFRERFFVQFEGGIRLSIWVGLFFLYPMVLWGFSMVNMFFDPGWSGAFIPTVAVALLLSELGIIYSQFVTTIWTPFKWIKQLDLEKSILAIFFPISIMLLFSATGVQEKMNTEPIFSQVLQGSYYVLQVYIILLVFYFFYLVNHYVLINKLFKNKGLIYYGFGFGATLVIFYPISALIIYNLPIVNLIRDTQDIINVFNPENANGPLFVMVLSIPFILSYQWLKQNNEIVTLEKEKSETELSLLKQQINPHFFFNTLNNLYALSLTKDERTPEVVIQLSELMRYVIYEGRKETTKLAEEVKYLEDYIKLQQIRLHKKLTIRFDKNIEDDQIKIPPLLFIILVENAFKHGIEPAEEASFLHIKLESNDKELVFSCKNSLEDHVAEGNGIGLDNLRRRLKLRFPERHQLTIEHLGDAFFANLKIHFENT